MAEARVGHDPLAGVPGNLGRWTADRLSPDPTEDILNVEKDRPCAEDDGGHPLRTPNPDEIPRRALANKTFQGVLKAFRVDQCGT